MTPMQKQVDELTKGMLATFDSAMAKELRRAVRLSDDEARRMIKEQRKKFGLPEDAGESPARGSDVA